MSLPHLQMVIYQSINGRVIQFFFFFHQSKGRSEVVCELWKQCKMLQTNMSYFCSQSKHKSSGSLCTWYNARDIKSNYKKPQNSLFSLDSFTTASRTSSNILSILTKMLDLAHITWVKFNLSVCVCAVTLAMTKSSEQ